MTQFRGNERAYEVHKSIPAWMRNSAAPPVWRILRQPWLNSVGNDALQRADRCRSTIAQASGSRDPTSIGVVLHSLFEADAMSAEAIVDVIDFVHLKELLLEGHVPVGISAQSSLESVIDRATDLGYTVPVVEERSAEQLKAESNAFDAAHHLMQRRFSSQMKFLASRFIVPDPRETKKIALLLDQVWVARDDYHPDRVRLLGLEVGSDLAGSAEDIRRDELLAVMGFEIFHASESWARVDPQRLIYCLLKSAGVPVLQQFTLNVPGKTIKQYLCAHCAGPMVRTPSGEGIVNEGEIFVHEECLNAAANAGLFTRTEP